jgi:uncharacterized protein (DUF1810 family)
MSNLKRFITAQEKIYTAALVEIKSGRKKSHWMWFIFPQVAGLGFSALSKHYAIRNKAEAQEYVEHLLLGKRLKEVSNAVLSINEKSAKEIFGSPDDLKLRSSMTLFNSLPNAHPVFKEVLDKYFNGEVDDKTVSLLQ